MYWIYRINPSYDGFTPNIIKKRLINNKFLIYNWVEYFDQIELNDIIFTYFRGQRINSGVYIISRIIEILDDKKVKGKIIDYNNKEPLISENDLKDDKKYIFNRPRGAVFVIPPKSEKLFNQILNRQVTSEIEILDKINCYDCDMNNEYRLCPIFGLENMINWRSEVDLSINEYKEVASPFWIIPHQSWWMKKSWGEHCISKFFYAFKSGYSSYARLFAEGIMITFERDDRFSGIKFDYIINIPLSPEKRGAGEYDRVNNICEILSKSLKIKYVKNNLYLTKNISRRSYKRKGLNNKFSEDYYEFLKWRTSENFDNRNVLVVDDVITDGNTLRTFAQKFFERFPRSNLYAVTCGIMAKKYNMKKEIIKHYIRNDI